MVQMLIIAACILVHMGDTPMFPTTAHPAAFVAYVGTLALMALCVELICRRAGRRMDRLGSGYARYQADRAILLTRFAAVFLHAVAVLGLGLVTWVRSHTTNLVLLDEFLCVLPVLVFFIAGWWSVYPLERRMRQALLYRELHEASDVQAFVGRGAFVWARARESLGVILIPVGLATASLESLDIVLAPVWKRIDANPSLDGYASMLHAIASTSVVLFVLAVAPALVRYAWDLVPLSQGRARSAIDAVFERRRIRVVGPLIWRTGTDTVNAAVLGAVFPFRYMVFTDALLSRLPPRQLQAVTAHEIAHVRLHHMPWMMACVFASVLALGWLAALAAWGAGISLESEVATTILSLVMLAPIAWLFGIVSRRMEWQADAYAARVLAELPPEPDPAMMLADDAMARNPVVPAAEIFGMTAGTPPALRITHEAAAAVAGALQSVADLNSMNPAARSFRHGSIQTRQRRILSLVGKDAHTLPIDRTVRYIKLAAVVAIVLSGAMTGLADLLAS